MYGQWNLRLHNTDPNITIYRYCRTIHKKICERIFTDTKFFQFLVTLLVHHNAGVISYAMFESIEHINMRFEHLCDTLVDTLKIKDPVERRKRFGKAVQYHYTLIE